MNIVLKITKDEKGNKVFTPLFVGEEYCNQQTSLITILEVMNGLLTPEQKEDIEFVSLYAGKHKFCDCPPMCGHGESKDIYFILKIVNDIPREILKVSKTSSNLTDIVEFLNAEIDNDVTCYKVLNVRGELNE